MTSTLRSLATLAAVSALAASLWWALRHWPFPPHTLRGDVVAEVYLHPILIADVQDSLRTYLWRRQLDWATMEAESRAAARQEVLRALADHLLLRRVRNASGRSESAPQDEFDAWRRQFQTESERASRLQRQGLTEDQWKALLSESELDLAWLESEVGNLQPPAEAEIAAWYDAHAKTLRIPEAWRASHLFLTAHDREKPDREPEIRNLHSSLRRGEKLEDLAASLSEDDRTKAGGGDLGWFTAERMPPDFIAAVANLERGQTGEPVRTKLGWHIIKLTGHACPRIPDLNEVRDEIAAHLASKRRARRGEEVLLQLRQRCTDEGAWYLDAALLSQIEPAATQ